jgi:hypothetical protein
MLEEEAVFFSQLGEETLVKETQHQLVAVVKEAFIKRAMVTVRQGQ